MVKAEEIEGIEVQEKVKEILKDAENGLNKESILAIICFNREIDLMKSMIDSLLSGTIWADYRKGIDMEDLNLDSFNFNLTEVHPINKEIYRFAGYEKEKKVEFENLDAKLSCLLCLQNFLSAGMTDEDALELFNRYFPEAKINRDDCSFIRQMPYRKFDKKIEKELGEKAREIVEIMKKDWNR